MWVRGGEGGEGGGGEGGGKRGEREWSLFHPVESGGEGAEVSNFPRLYAWGIAALHHGGKIPISELKTKTTQKAVPAGLNIPVYKPA
jgi:hypothetical protein